MSEDKDVLAIIPARGGSKGIPRKNLADLAGKPLIAYSILAAKHSKLIDRIIVSTEDEEIAEVAKALGAEVPFLRPRELAEDTSGIGKALSYTLSRLGGVHAFKAYVQLYPTSPFRSPEFIDEMLSILFSGFSSVSTVKKVFFDPNFLFIRDENTKDLVNILGESDAVPMWKQYYRNYSVLHASMPQRLEKHYYKVLSNKCMLIDIDTPEDLRLAEAVIRNDLFEFGF